MPVSKKHTGWRKDPANSRLDMYYEGTRVGHIDASGLSTASGTVSNSGVAKTGLPTGFLNVTLVNGGAAGNFTVTGIATADEIVFVGHFSTAAAIATLADLTAEFSITAADTINNTSGTDTTSDQLMVMWVDLT